MGALADVKTKLGEVSAAVEASDFATASLKLISARVLMVGVPDAEKEGDRVEYSRAGREIEGLQRIIDQRRGSALGVQRTKIQHARPVPLEDYC